MAGRARGAAAAWCAVAAGRARASIAVAFKARGQHGVVHVPLTAAYMTDTMIKLVQARTFGT